MLSYSCDEIFLRTTWARVSVSTRFDWQTISLHETLRHHLPAHTQSSVRRLAMSGAAVPHRDLAHLEAIRWAHKRRRVSWSSAGASGTRKAKPFSLIAETIGWSVQGRRASARLRIGLAVQRRRTRGHQHEAPLRDLMDTPFGEILCRVAREFLGLPTDAHGAIRRQPAGVE